MFPLAIRPLVRLLCAALAVAAAAQGAVGQAPATQHPPAHGLSVETKLTQAADFVPPDTSPLEQLIAVAKHYQLPMGIEWIERTEGAAAQLAVRPGATVHDLLNAIVKNAVGYRVALENGVLHVNRPELTDDPLNLLNLRIPRFKVHEQNLFMAESSLRLAMELTLYPEEFEEGYMSDSGYPPGHVFDVDNVTISGYHQSVRDILDLIATANGNALWVVQLDYTPAVPGAPLRLKNVKPSGPVAIGLHTNGRRSSRRPPDDDTSGTKVFRWDFIPLTNVENDSSIITKEFTSPPP